MNIVPSSSTHHLNPSPRSCLLPSIIHLILSFAIHHENSFDLVLQSLTIVSGILNHRFSTLLKNCLLIRPRSFRPQHFFWIVTSLPKHLPCTISSLRDSSKPSFKVLRRRTSHPVEDLLSSRRSNLHFIDTQPTPTSSAQARFITIRLTIVNQSYRSYRDPPAILFHFP